MEFGKSLNGTLKMKTQDLKEIIEFSGRKAAGKILKRFEIFGGHENLKKEVKELIFESYRDAQDLIMAAGYGVESLTQFKFDKPKKEDISS